MRVLTTVMSAIFWQRGYKFGHVTAILEHRPKVGYMVPWQTTQLPWVAEVLFAAFTARLADRQQHRAIDPKL